MHTASDVTQLIGNTPLLHLKQVSEQTGCTILGKAEFLNPGGSVKDRTALGIIRAAQRPPASCSRAGASSRARRAIPVLA